MGYAGIPNLDQYGEQYLSVVSIEPSYETFDECGSRNVEVGRMESLRSVFFLVDRIHSFDIRYSLFQSFFFD
jgi:hypothetical protein